ncbi:MAG: RING finger domain-containing protein, partial [Promethearchaeota archaeon]
MSEVKNDSDIEEEEEEDPYDIWVDDTPIIPSTEDEYFSLPRDARHTLQQHFKHNPDARPQWYMSLIEQLSKPGGITIQFKEHTDDTCIFMNEAHKITLGDMRICINQLLMDSLQCDPPPLTPLTQFEMNQNFSFQVTQPPHIYAFHELSPPEKITLARIWLHTCKGYPGPPLPEWLVARTPNAPYKPFAEETIPYVKYRRIMEYTGQTAAKYVAVKNPTATGCSICLKDFEDQSNCVLINTCKHMYHLDCLAEWYISLYTMNLSEDLTCPLCRKKQTIHHDDKQRTIHFKQVSQSAAD